MKPIRTLILVTAIFATGPAQAADSINYRELNQEGFGDVGQLLQSMTPQQRDAVLKQAAIKQQDLQKLTPQQMEQLRKQLHAIDDTIAVDKVDPAKLDTSKAKSTADTQKDFDSYQQKYDEGKIHNAVVKQPGDNDGQ